MDVLFIGELGEKWKGATGLEGFGGPFRENRVFFQEATYVWVWVHIESPGIGPLIVVSIYQGPILGTDV